MRCKITTKLGTVGVCVVCFFILGMVYLGCDPVLLLFRLQHCDTANAGEEPLPFGCRTHHPISGLETGPPHSICILTSPHLQSPQLPNPPESYIYIHIFMIRTWIYREVSPLKLKMKENQKRCHCYRFYINLNVLICTAQ